MFGKFRVEYEKGLGGTGMVGRLDFSHKRGWYNCSYVVAIYFAAATELRWGRCARKYRYSRIKVDFPSENLTVHALVR